MSHDPLFTLLPHLLAPDPPDLRPDTLPADERAAGEAIALNLDAMSKHAQEFASCVALFQISGDESRGRDLWRSWHFIAPKAAIVAVYNYRMAMDDTMSARRNCPTWKRELDNAALERVRQDFRSSFPHTKELRQTVLHGAERFSKPERHSRNALKTDYKRAGVHISAGANPTSRSIVDANIINNTYTCLFGGQIYELDLNSDKVEQLVAATRAFFGTFRRLQV